MAIRWHIRWRSHGETARVKGWYDTGPELPRINPMNSQTPQDQPNELPRIAPAHRMSCIDDPRVERAAAST